MIEVLRAEVDEVRFSVDLYGKSGVNTLIFTYAGFDLELLTNNMIEFLNFIDIGFSI
jgi:hypothetical protein